MSGVLPPAVWLYGAMLLSTTKRGRPAGSTPKSRTRSGQTCSAYQRALLPRSQSHVVHTTKCSPVSFQHFARSAWKALATRISTHSSPHFQSTCCQYFCSSGAIHELSSARNLQPSASRLLTSAASATSTGLTHVPPS